MMSFKQVLGFFLAFIAVISVLNFVVQALSQDWEKAFWSVVVGVICAFLGYVLARKEL